MQRAYGSDSYWKDRYEDRSQEKEDHTDEWLLHWVHLAPLLDLPSDGQSIIDLGCGNSSLPLDLLKERPASRVVGVDIAEAAIAEQRTRMRSADNAEFFAFDLTDRKAWAATLAERTFDVAIDKSTTDGLLCDTKRGAKRVRSIYANLAASLAPAATVAVISWRAPEDGLEWFADCVVGALREATDGAESTSSWSLDVHSLIRDDSDGEAQAVPHVYLLRRRPRRRSSRLGATRKRARDEGDDSLEVRLHEHPC